MARATANMGDVVAAPAPAGDERVGALLRTESHRKRRVLRRLARHKSAAIGFAIIVVLIVVALTAPFIAPYDPIDLSRNILQSPSGDHVMGTDNLGRDIFSRVVYGTRISLQMGFIAIAIAATVGTTVGLVAGTYGGLVDNVFMRFVDALMAVPGILLALTVAAVLGTGLHVAMIAVGIAWIPGFARIVRSLVLQVNAMPYIEAAKSLGSSDTRLIWRHVLPNALTPVLVLASLGIGSAVLIGAALSFLGVGAKPPTPEWGIMLSEGRQFMRSAWWVMAFPGLAITVTVLAANLVGDGLRDALDPRIKL
jgi:peptide/nickel transport system permease protein